MPPPASTTGNPSEHPKIFYPDLLTERGRVLFPTFPQQRPLALLPAIPTYVPIPGIQPAYIAPGPQGGCLPLSDERAIHANFFADLEVRLRAAQRIVQNYKGRVAMSHGIQQHIDDAADDMYTFSNDLGS